MRDQSRLEGIVLGCATMSKNRHASVGERRQRVERISSRVAVRLGKGQSVSRSDGVGVIFACPVPGLAANVSEFQSRIFPKLALYGQVVLIGVWRPVPELLANAGGA